MSKYYKTGLKGQRMTSKDTELSPEAPKKPRAKSAWQARKEAQELLDEAQKKEDEEKQVRHTCHTCSRAQIVSVSRHCFSHRKFLLVARRKDRAPRHCQEDKAF